MSTGASSAILFVELVAVAMEPLQPTNPDAQSQQTLCALNISCFARRLSRWTGSTSRLSNSELLCFCMSYSQMYELFSDRQRLEQCRGNTAVFDFVCSGSMAALHNTTAYEVDPATDTDQQLMVAMGISRSLTRLPCSPPGECSPLIQWHHRPVCQGISSSRPVCRYIDW